MSAVAPVADPTASEEPVQHPSTVAGSGDLSYLYGYIPVVVVSHNESDDTVEIAKFGAFDRVPAGDVSAVIRGPIPTDEAVAGPAQAELDRIEKLESTVAKQSELITALLEKLDPGSTTGGGVGKIADPMTDRTSG